VLPSRGDFIFGPGVENGEGGAVWGSKVAKNPDFMPPLDISAGMQYNGLAG